MKWLDKYFNLTREVLILLMYETFKEDDPINDWVNDNAEYYNKNYPNGVMNIDYDQVADIQPKCAALLEMLGCSLIDDYVSESLYALLKKRFTYSYLITANANVVDSHRFIENLNKRVEYNMHVVYCHLCAMLFFAFKDGIRITNSKPLNGYIGFFVKNKDIINAYSVYDDDDTIETASQGEKELVSILKQQVYDRIGNLTRPETFIDNPKNSPIIQRLLAISKKHNINLRELFTKNTPTEEEVDNLLLTYIRTELVGNQDDEETAQKPIYFDAVAQYLANAIHTQIISGAFFKP